MMRPKDLRQGSGTKTFLDAMHGGKVHLARFILDALDGRIINSKTENSRTPLMYAACLQDPGSRVKFTHLLLEKGADVNCQDEDGRTALSLACEMGQLDVVKLLVQFNADPDISDAWGNSALMYAAFSGHNQVLEFLVRAFKRLGLRLDRTNNAGHSAIEVASFFGHSHCVQILKFPCRKSIVSEEPLTETDNIGNGAFRLPNKLPRYVLERFSKQCNSTDDQLPTLFQKQLKIGDSNGLWSRFRCPGNQSQDDNQRHSWALPSQIGKNQNPADQSVVFAAKQLQNCQLKEVMATKTLNSEITQKDLTKDNGFHRQISESSSAGGKDKPFNMDLVIGRKQSYQGDARDMRLSASKLKRASLQDEGCLLGKKDSQGNFWVLTKDADKTMPKAFLTNKNLAAKAHEHSEIEMVSDTVPSGKREQQKRGSLGSTTRHKLPFAKGEMDSGKSSNHTPGFLGLGTRLLRRFTAPDFMRMVADCSSRSAQSRGRIMRSETFPFSHTHQQVNSQPSVDSISVVKCEFESCSSQFSLD